MKTKTTSTLPQKITEGAIFLALSFVLCYFKLLDLPYGGSITLCSMLPLILVAYRHGTGFGLLVGFAGSLLQLLLGLNNLSYATSAAAAVAIVLLDYLLAFTVTGLGGLFRHRLSQPISLVSGTVLVCLLRYLCHVISGCTVWAGLSIPDKQALFYSLIYNATYMLPELLITALGAAWLGHTLDFQSKTLSRRTPNGARTFLRSPFVTLSGVIVLTADILIIAPHLQDAKTGAFSVTGIFSVPWNTVLWVTVGGFIWIVCLCLFWRKKK